MHSRWIILAAFCAIPGGLWLGYSVSFLIDKNYLMFQRTGALAILGGVWSFSIPRYFLIPDLLDLKVADRTWKEGENIPLLESEIGVISDRFKNAVKTKGSIELLFKSMAQKLFFYEITLVSIGTLQWGYGDFFGALVQCGKLKC